MLRAAAERHWGADESRGCSSTDFSSPTTPRFRSPPPAAPSPGLTRIPISGLLDDRFSRHQEQLGLGSGLLPVQSTPTGPLSFDAQDRRRIGGRPSDEPQ